MLLIEVAKIKHSGFDSVRVSNANASGVSYDRAKGEVSHRLLTERSRYGRSLLGEASIPVGRRGNLLRRFWSPGRRRA